MLRTLTLYPERKVDRLADPPEDSCDYVHPDYDLTICSDEAVDWFDVEDFTEPLTLVLSTKHTPGFRWNIFKICHMQHAGFAEFYEVWLISEDHLRTIINKRTLQKISKELFGFSDVPEIIYIASLKQLIEALESKKAQ